MRRLPRFSQHFLRNPQFVAELVRRAGIDASDVVYDLGAGSGIITSALAARASRVVAVELEPGASAKLAANTAKFDNVEVVQGDILTVALPTTSYKVFANIPFHISSQVVRRLTEAANPPDAAYLIVQKQFAQKLVLGNGHFTGALAMMIAPWFITSVVRPLRRTDYSPQPNVDTVLMCIERRDQALLDVVHAATYRDFVAQCYHDPKVFAKAPRAKAGVATGVKPSELTVETWVRLYLASVTTKNVI